MKEFFTTVQGKIIGVLTIIALLFGIGAEGASMYRNAMEGLTSQSVARESAARQEAERRVQQALAEKTAAEQRTAEAVANESRLRQEAERREKQALAEKTAAEQHTAEAVARESAARQEAERRVQQALAEKTAAEQRTASAAADVQEFIAKKITRGTGDSGDIVRNLEGAGNLSDPFASGPARPSSAANEAPATAQQLTPECRQHFAEWQAYTSHAAFAFVPVTTIGCAWNGGNKSVLRGSTAQAIGALKDYCNDKHLACAIIATK